MQQYRENVYAKIAFCTGSLAKRNGICESKEERESREGFKKEEGV